MKGRECEGSFISQRCENAKEKRESPVSVLYEKQEKREAQGREVSVGETKVMKDLLLEKRLPGEPACVHSNGDKSQDWVLCERNNGTDRRKERETCLTREKVKTNYRER